MRLLHAKYSDRQGTSCESRKWYVEIRYRDVVQRFPAFKDKGASEALGRKLEKLAELSTGGESPDPALTRWVESLPAKLRNRLAKLGILDAKRLAAAQPLTVLLDEFHASLCSRGNTEKHADQTKARALRVLTGCGFEFWSEIEPLPVERFLRDLRETKPVTKAEAGGDDATESVDERGLSAATSNYLLAAARQFCRWMVKAGRASEDPLRVLDPLNARVDQRRTRRALSEVELCALVSKTAEGPERCGMSGPERALLYALAVETGLRASELASLRVGGFNLDPKNLTVTLRAAYSKRRREDVLPLREGTAIALRGFLRGRMPSALAFSIPPHWRSAEMFAEDMKAAGLKSNDDEGRIADFHALRHSFLSLLCRGGVSPKQAQALARHSTITLTMDRYTHLRSEDGARALDVLPNLWQTPENTVLATGTTGEPVLPLCLPTDPAFASTHSHLDAPCSGAVARPGGLEPPTVGLEIRCEADTAKRTLPLQFPALPTLSNASPEERLAALLALLGPEEPELAVILAAWSRLPAAVKSALAALARSSAG